MMFTLFSRGSTKLQRSWRRWRRSWGTKCWARGTRLEVEHDEVEVEVELEREEAECLAALGA